MTSSRLGRLIQPIRAGENRTVWYHHATRHAPNTITVTSTAFCDGGPIPQRHAGKGLGDNISPQLAWSGVPAETAELMLIVEDPDAPLPRPIVHTLATGIKHSTRGLPEHTLNHKQKYSATPHDICIGRGSFMRRGYAGPRPIPGHGPHCYIFQLFALDQPTGLDSNATVRTALSAINGHVIARGRLTGIYER